MAAQDEEERLKQSMLELIKSAPSVDVASILLPYVTHPRHAMKASVNLHLRVLNSAPAPPLPPPAAHTAAEAYLAAATDPSGEALPALTIADEAAAPAAHTSGSHAADGSMGSVTSISVMAGGGPALAISTAELKEKLDRYRAVVVRVDTLRREKKQRGGGGERAEEKEGGVAPQAIVLDKSEEVIEAEDICVDVQFKATLAELITDITQLTLAA